MTPSRLRSAIARRLRTGRLRARRDRRALVGDDTLTEAERKVARRVSTRISHRDAMHGGAGRHYFAVGLSALRCVEAGLAAAAGPPVESILDLPCGHGRVLRWLAARFPQARLTACDLDADGVGYCARAFGADPVPSVADFDRLDLAASFDLVWCGSLVTHLDADRIGKLLRRFARHLGPRGVLVLTTHGERAAENLRSRRLNYLLSDEQVAQVTDAYESSGFGYADYAGQPGYGVSLTSPAWVTGQGEQAGLRPVWSRLAGWDDHQDVFAFAGFRRGGA